MQIVSGCCNTSWLLLSSLMNCFEVGDLGLIFMYLTLPSDFVQHWWWCYPYFQTHAVHCGFVESVHDFAVQGGAIMSFVGYFLLDKHFGSSIGERNSSSTTNTGILILLLTNSVSMFVLVQECLSTDMLVVVSFVVQDWHCDGEERQTHRMGNNTSLLELPTGQTCVARSAEHLACEHFTALWLHASASILKHLNHISVRITSVSSSTESWEHWIDQTTASCWCYFFTGYLYVMSL